MDAFPNFVYLYGAKVLGPGGMVKLRIPRFIFVDRHRCSGRTGVYVLEAKGTRHLDLDLDGTSLWCVQIARFRSRSALDNLIWNTEVFKRFKVF